MENNSTVKYSSKHRYGATKRFHKAKLAMGRSKKQKAYQEYDSDTTIIDCHCAEVCDSRDVESSNSLDVSCSKFKLNSLKTDWATPSSTWCITDLEMINALLTNVECPTCQASSCLTFTIMLALQSHSPSMISWFYPFHKLVLDILVCRH